MADIEQIERELRDGLDGVTPGPYTVTTCVDFWIEANGKGIAQCGDISWLHAETTINSQDEMEANASHFANCTPENIRILLDELSRSKEAEKRYREALAPFAALNVPADEKWTCGTFLIEHEAIRAARAALGEKG